MSQLVARLLRLSTTWLQSSRPAAVSCCIFALCLLAKPQSAAAQLALDDIQLGDNMDAAEASVWSLLQDGKPIRAREAAEQLLKRQPNSFVARFVVGLVLHYQEADFPRSLYHSKRALEAYEARFGANPEDPKTWRWHARLIRELVSVYGDLEQHTEKLAMVARFNKLYEPDMLAERAWPLMKLRKFDAARKAAQDGLKSDQAAQTEIALNALCAIEFEAGNDESSYRACKEALNYARDTRGSVNAVDLTNFAEASRSVFRLDEAERTLLEATRAKAAWYGNPWLELAELYVRQGRYAEALSALKRTTEYRNNRPPHVRNADRNESWRAIASLLFLTGRFRDAEVITSRALMIPDRRGHNSRAKYQDRAVTALLDAGVKRCLAQKLVENAVGEPWWKRIYVRAQAAWLRFNAWKSGRTAMRLLAQDENLSGLMRIGTAKSAITPPWLLGELVRIAGPTVTERAIRAAKQRDQRRLAPAYYQALLVENFARKGSRAMALKQYRGTAAVLKSRDLVLFARISAHAADAAYEDGQFALARGYFEETFETDPGALRRADLPVPIYIKAGQQGLLDRLSDLASRSPRFRIVSKTRAAAALHLDVRGRSFRCCLKTTVGNTLACGEPVQAKRDTSPKQMVAKAMRSLHDLAFSPRIDLSQSDARSLDGSNRVSRNPLEDLFNLGTP